VSAPVPSWLPLTELTGELPAQTDVLVIGGGLAGVLLARGLATAGVEVLVVERAELNREASGANAGSVHLQIAIHQLTGPDTSDAVDRLTEESRLARRAAQIWRDLDGSSGGRVAYHEIGGVMVADTDAELALLREKHLIEADAGLETHVLEGEALREVAPYLSPAVRAVTYCPQEGHVDPLAAVPLIAADAVARGARIRVHAAVRSIGAEGAAGGGPFRVQTSAGTVLARRVINAAGAWAGEVGALAGGRLPLVRLPLHVNVTEARPALVGHLVQHIARRLTLKQSPSGTFIIGGGWPSREDSPERRPVTLWSSAAGNAAVALDVIPALAGVRLLRTWSGVTAWMHDVSPILGQTRGAPGMYACVVGSSGYTMTPAFVEILVAHLTGGTPLPDAYSPDRPPTRPEPRIHA
jgi:glycine/D-amino acid oxidase-like deaminating enzyme